MNYTRTLMLQQPSYVNHTSSCASLTRLFSCCEELRKIQVVRLQPIPLRRQCHLSLDIREQEMLSSTGLTPPIPSRSPPTTSTSSSRFSCPRLWRNCQSIALRKTKKPNLPSNRLKTCADWRWSSFGLQMTHLAKDGSKWLASDECKRDSLGETMHYKSKTPCKRMKIEVMSWDYHHILIKDT